MEVHSEMNEFYNERIIREPPLPSHTHTQGKLLNTLHDFG